MIEYADLFKRSLGLETDVVTKEMYILKGDEDEAQLCLTARGNSFMCACICK